MSRYYFLVASLPTLQYDQAPPFGHERLRWLCEGQLSAPDLDAFDRARLDVSQGDAGTRLAVLRWRRWEISLRNALARARAAARGTDAVRYVRPIPSLPYENSGADTVETEGVARSAVAAPNPMAAQDILDRARWALLDDLERGHPFTLDVVIARSLKLQLLERRGLAVAERGQEVLERIRGAAAQKIRAGEALNG